MTRSPEQPLVHQGFLKAGHLPTLAAAFPYFDLSCMTGVLTGPLGIAIAGDLHRNAAQKVATPVLAGAFRRVVPGLPIDRHKPNRFGIAEQIDGAARV